MNKITKKILILIAIGLFSCGMNAQTFYYEDFRYDNIGRGFTVQKVNDGGQPVELGKRISDVVDAADSSPVFSISSRPTTRVPNGSSREQRAISFKNTSGSGSSLANHEIEGWALMTNQDLSTKTAPEVSFWTQQRSVIGSGSSITVWVSQNYTHGNAPNTATWTDETSNIIGSIASAGVSDNIYVHGKLDLSSYTGTSVTVAFKVLTDNTAYSSGTNQHGTFYISDVRFEAERENVLPGPFSALNTSATGQSDIFNTPTASIDNTNFSNTSKWNNVLTTDNSVPRLTNGSLIPIGEGYKFEVSDKYNPIVVSEVSYKLANAASNKGGPNGSIWTVQGSNDDVSWDDLSDPVQMFSANTGDIYNITLRTTKPYRFYRFVLSSAWTPNQGFTALQQLDFTIASLWTGASDSNWNTITNWNTNVIPTDHDVIIPTGLTNYPTIPTGTTVSTSNIRIESGATLIAEGSSTVTGTVTYKRNLSFTAGAENGWHLVGAPITGQIYNDDYVSKNSIAGGSTSSSNRGIATYINGTPNSTTGPWDYLQSGESGSFNKATGYSIKTSKTTDISFTGTLHTANTELKQITVGTDTPFNLIANPYTSYVNAKTFLELPANSGKLTNEQIWIWNPTTKNYESKLSGDNIPFQIAPGQAFFVSCISNGDLEFLETNQSHQNTDTFLKNKNSPEIKLNITNGELERYTKIRYSHNATKKFDRGNDGETFSGAVNNFDIFTHLLEDNQGKNYQIQSLPKKSIEQMVIPIGVKSDPGEIIFSAQVSGLNPGLKIFLEDRNNNTFNRLDVLNSSYKTSTKEKLNGTGRFFLHTSQKSLSTKNNSLLNTISIYKADNTTLRVAGLEKTNTNFKLFNILGKQLVNTNFIANGTKEISLPKVAKGIYLVKITTENGSWNKKIIIE